MVQVDGFARSVELPFQLILSYDVGDMGGYMICNDSSLVEFFTTNCRLYLSLSN